MKKKGLAVLLAAAMTMGIAGCGSTEAQTGASSEEKQESSVQESSTQESAAGEAEGTSEAAVEPSYDFNGRVVRIGSYFDMTPNPDGNVFEQAYSKRIKYVEDNYNCKIEFVNVGGDYTGAYVNSVLAGDPVCDVGYMLSYKLLPALIEGGIAYPISDLGVVDFSAPQYDQAAVEACTYKGKVYAMQQTGAGCGYGIFYNKTLFERYNLPDLYELYDNGEWTWDKMKEIALAGNQDLDGDGVYGEDDIHGFNWRENLIWSYMASNGADAVRKTDTGVELALDTPEAMEAMEAYADFLQNVPTLTGWLGDWQSEIWNFRDGKSCMCYEAWWISYGYLNKEDGSGMQDDWGFVPFPKGPSGTEYVSYNKEAAPLMMLNGIDNPEEVATIIDLIFQSFETEEDWNDAIEATFEAQANDAKAVEIAEDLMGKVSVSPLMGFKDLNTLVNDMLKSIENGEQTPQTALEAQKSALDAAIADIQTHDYEADMKEAAEKYEEAQKESESASKSE